jgi:hypothetical protein
MPLAQKLIKTLAPINSLGDKDRKEASSAIPQAVAHPAGTLRPPLSRFSRLPARLKNLIARSDNPL